MGRVTIEKRSQGLWLAEGAWHCTTQCVDASELVSEHSRRAVDQSFATYTTTTAWSFLKCRRQHGPSNPKCVHKLVWQSPNSRNVAPFSSQVHAGISRKGDPFYTPICFHGPLVLALSRRQAIVPALHLTSKI